MRMKVHRETDALYFRFDEAQIVESEEVEPGVILDYNADEQVVGIEILGISSRFSKNELSSIHFEAA